MQLCSAMTKSPPGMAAEASWEVGGCSGFPCRQLGSCNPERRTTICSWHSRKLEPARAPLGRWAPLPFVVLTPPQGSARREVCCERTWPVTLWAAPIPAAPRKPFHAWIQLPRIVLVCRGLGGVWLRSLNKSRSSEFPPGPRPTPNVRPGESLRGPLIWLGFSNSCRKVHIMLTELPVLWHRIQDCSSVGTYLVPRTRFPMK